MWLSCFIGTKNLECVQLYLAFYYSFIGYNSCLSSFACTFHESLTMFKNMGSEDALKKLMKGHWKEYNNSSYSLILYVKSNTKKKKKKIPHCILYFPKLKRLFCLGYTLTGGTFGKHTHTSFAKVLFPWVTNFPRFAEDIAGFTIKHSKLYIPENFLCLGILGWSLFLWRPGVPMVC